MKIAVNLISFHDTKSVGTMMYVKRLFHELDFYKSRNEYVCYIQKHINVTNIIVPNNINIRWVKVPRLHNKYLRFLFEQIVFPFYLKNVDLLFCPTLSLPVFARIKKILVLHDMVAFKVNDKYSIIRKYIILFFTKILVLCSDVILTVSDNSKNDIEKILRVRPSKVKRIYNFISSDESKLIFNSIKNVEIGEKNDEYFLCVSTLQPAKNIIGTIISFDKFLSENESGILFKLYIAGNKGWNYNEIFKVLDTLENKRSILFLGYINDEELRKLYKNCFGVLYLSFYEGFGYPPLEGFYFNKSCVVSNTSSLPEIVGNSGIVVNPHSIDDIVNGLNKFISYREDYMKNIPSQLSKFKPKKAIDEYERIFKIATI